jgi:hypothetical protein
MSGTCSKHGEVQNVHTILVSKVEYMTAVDRLRLGGRLIVKFALKLGCG